MLIAEAGERLVGVLRLCPEEGARVLRGMRVVRDLQRRGIGSLLLGLADQEIGAGGCYCIAYPYLDRFYGQIGFQPLEPTAAPRFLSERLAEYQARGLDAALMHRPPRATQARSKEQQTMSIDPLNLTRVFAAPPERLYRAWTEPRDLERWAWGSIGKSVQASVDAKVGGAYEIVTARPDGASWRFFGEFVEIEPDRRLVYTLHWDAPMGYPAREERIVVEFSPIAEGTKVTFRHHELPDERSAKGHVEGWENTFDCLAALLEPSSGAPREQE